MSDRALKQHAYEYHRRRYLPAAIEQTRRKLEHLAREAERLGVAL